VLRARLADARFFWEQDRKIPLASRVEALAERVYHARLGSVLDKVRRMGQIAEYLVAHVPGADTERVRRATLLAKADLSTGMVGEFPELQGVMGRYYARFDDENPRVANAIADHYKPQGPNDTCPTTPDSIVVALADKLDTLAAFFAIGEKPTGSRDPFALRRAALGAIRLILENQLHVPLWGAVQSVWGAEDHDAMQDLLAFIAERLKVHLRENGFRHDHIAAVFARFGVGVEDDLLRVRECLEAVTRFLSSDDGVNLLIAYRRASNIVAIEERRDNCFYDGDVSSSVFCQAEEDSLFSKLRIISQTVDTFYNENRFDDAMSALATLRRPVDEFFDKVTVNTEDRALRENRLRLLSRIRAVMNRVADFSQIEG
jgi:glycyl-tRNA synthetase beta chain